MATTEGQTANANNEPTSGALVDLFLNETFTALARRSCKEETEKTIQGHRTGEIPKWIRGCLLRNGPGLVEVGEDKYNHWFDGLALIQKFAIENGEATYRNKFVRSESFKKNMAANRIVVSEFGTAAHPDPCATLFDKFKSHFTLEMTDNTNINLLKIGDQFYAATETNLIRRIDIETLESKEQVNLSNYLAVNTATAHTHYENDGTVYNIGNSFKGWPCYNFICFPPTKNSTERDESLKKAFVVCKISAERALHPSYYHSFGVTENYLILVEQPLLINVPKLLWNLGKSSLGESLHWEQKQLVRIHVIHKSTGKPVPIKFLANPFVVFHHANSYEEDNHIVMDLCAYDNADVINSFFLGEKKGDDMAIFQKTFAQVRRFVLPLQASARKVNNIGTSENLVTLNGTSAVACKQKDGSLLCHPEVLSKGLDTMELPQVNYRFYNGKKYRFLYGLGKETGRLEFGLIKLNVEQKNFKLWFESGKTPTEPIFVPKPNAEDEDDGVILSSLMHNDFENNVTLLILDAKNMQELSRVEFETKSQVTNSLHGPYVPL